MQNLNWHIFLFQSPRNGEDLSEGEGEGEGEGEEPTSPNNNDLDIINHHNSINNKGVSYFLHG